MPELFVIAGCCWVGMVLTRILGNANEDRLRQENIDAERDLIKSLGLDVPNTKQTQTTRPN